MDRTFLFVFTKKEQHIPNPVIPYQSLQIAETGHKRDSEQNYF